MTRVPAIFIAATTMLVAAALGLFLYDVTGLSGAESAIVALAALTCLSLYTAVAMRQRDRTDAGNQIADLSRGTGDLARQVAELGRSLSALERRMASAESAGTERIQAVAGKISDLGAHLKELSASVAYHDGLLRERVRAAAGALPDAAETFAGGAGPGPAGPAAHPDVVAAGAAAPPRAPTLGALRRAVEEGRVDVYLQPIVTLPQRKVRFYDAVARLGDDGSEALPVEDLIGAEAEGGRIDHMMLLRSVEALRRLSVCSTDVGVFCNMAAATLDTAEAFAPCLDFLDANRALASSFVLKLGQSVFRELRPAAAENLAALVQRGYRFSMDHVTDLRFEPRELADHGVRYVKIPAALLLDPKQAAVSDLHPSELSDLLGRVGIDLIAERIERESTVIDLLDCDVRLGQGLLFAPPRPLRSEGGETGQMGFEPHPTATPGLRAASSS